MVLTWDDAAVGLLEQYNYLKKKNVYSRTNRIGSQQGKNWS